uniref:Uncharacterized protein n=1 Tax=Ditylum brightwellii TaxID=49249 RepID=A0A6V2DJS2_9STRA|mmetsp:Transcript_14251/g.19006  ORF Transcript_14251/g.19006 Transcript_14251/m.19006 type:complete len:1241 (+) Transcript_14251:835-4557(+)
MSRMSSNMTYVTKWTCDICKVAEFDTFAEALKHEENCKITRPSVESTMLPVLSKNIGRSATQETENSTTQDTKMKTMWTCDFCDTARFNTFEEALKHEKKCKASKSTAAMNKVQPDSAKEKPKTSATEGAKLVTKWTCDVCGVATFDSFDEACKHEKQCTGGKKVAAKETCVPANDRKKGPSAQAAPMIIAQSATLPNSAPKPVANTASPPTMTFQYPPQHKQLSPPGQPIAATPYLSPAFPKQLSPSPTKTRMVSTANTTPILILEPLIRDSGDSKLFYSLSTYHVVILKLLDLFEIRRPIKTVTASNASHYHRIVGFRCNRCKCVYPGPWSISRFTFQMPRLVFSHLSSSCSKFDAALIDGLKKAAHTQFNGKVSLYDFGVAFFTENGLKDSKISTDSINGGLELTILDENKSWVFQKSTRRGEWMSSNHIVPKNPIVPIVPKQVCAKDTTAHRIAPKIPAQSQKIPTPKKTSNIGLSQTGGIPLISKEYNPKEPVVSAFLHLAMSQMELRPTFLEPNGVYYSLALHCKHCSSLCRPSSYEHWFKSVYSLTYSHLIKSCGSIPYKIRKKLTEYKIDKSKTTGGIGLRVFCEYLNGVHGLIDTAVAGGKGYSPGLGILQQRMTGSFSHQKVPKAKKHPLPKMSPLNAFDTKKPKIDHNNFMKPIATLSLPVLKRHIDEEGNHCYLPPDEGVPLISSQSSVMSAKLSRYIWLILDQLEFFDGEQLKSPPESISHKFVGIRCRNCSNDPKFRFFTKLTKLDSMSDDINMIARTHSTICPCTPRRTLQELTTTALKKNKNAVSLKEYCKHLSNIYGMKEFRGNSLSENAGTVLGVVWDHCQLLPTGYSGQPSDPSLTRKKVPVTVSTVPVHNLMIGHPKKTFAEPKEIIANASSQIIVSDYSYIFISQLEFAPVKRKMLLPYKTARQRSRQQGPMDGSSDLKSSSDTTNDISIAVRCKYCFTAKSSSTVQYCVNNVSNQFYTHFRKCAHFPPALLSKLEECKVYQAMQKSPMLMTLAEYIRKIMCEIYEMEDLEWNGVSGGVGFKNMEKTKTNYGVKIDNLQKNATGNANEEFENVGGFTLPLLLDGLVQPCTTGLLDGIAKTSSKTAKDGPTKLPSSTKMILAKETGNAETNETLKTVVKHLDAVVPMDATSSKDGPIYDTKMNNCKNANEVTMHNVGVGNGLVKATQSNIQGGHVVTNNGDNNNANPSILGNANSKTGSKESPKYSYDTLMKMMEEDIIV